MTEYLLESPVQEVEPKTLRVALSTAISLKRIADAMDTITELDSDRLGAFIVATVKAAKPEIEKL